MQQILMPDERVLAVLGNAHTASSPCRMMKYTVSSQAPDGVLLHNLLTRELLHLSYEEYELRFQLPALWERWFVVPEDTREKELADLVRWALEHMQPLSGDITAYTILTTTYCNARCPYCFERGRSRITMSPETARQTVGYIRSHCGGKPVSLHWFGGEPLVNPGAIREICRGLGEEGIAYHSAMITNGFLFDGERIREAKELWKLTKVQITLDGTEPEYNRIKAYVSPSENPYRRVMRNIEALLEAGMDVSLRLNVDAANADDILQLVEELSRRFAGRKKPKVYASPIQDDCGSWNGQELLPKLCRIGDCLRQYGLSGKGRLKPSLPLHHCMADSGSSVLIAPDGQLGRCEHFTDRDFFGQLTSPEVNQAVLDSWKQRRPELPACKDCPFYPECIVPEKCGSFRCSPAQRELHLYQLRNTMEDEFLRWKNSRGSTEPATEEDYGAILSHRQLPCENE